MTLLSQGRVYNYVGPKHLEVQIPQVWGRWTNKRDQSKYRGPGHGSSAGKENPLKSIICGKIVWSWVNGGVREKRRECAARQLCTVNSHSSHEGGLHNHSLLVWLKPRGKYLHLREYVKRRCRHHAVSVSLPLEIFSEWVTIRKFTIMITTNLTFMLVTPPIQSADSLILCFHKEN